LGKGATDFSPPAAIGIPAVLLGTGALFSALLLLWSVFFEFIWIRKKRGIAAGATVDSGTYSLCRHPGFWWLAFLAVFLGILRGIERYYITIILMIALDFLLVFIQDRYVFPRVFPDYLEYRKKVPFLVPRPRRGRTEPNGD
jgi:protein-S-isoprenylcysteine O-methyltransferase Ste14